MILCASMFVSLGAFDIEDQLKYDLAKLPYSSEYTYLTLGKDFLFPGANKPADEKKYAYAYQYFFLADVDPGKKKWEIPPIPLLFVIKIAENKYIVHKDMIQYVELARRYDYQKFNVICLGDISAFTSDQEKIIYLEEYDFIEKGTDIFRNKESWESVTPA